MASSWSGPERLAHLACALALCVGCGSLGKDLLTGRAGHLVRLAERPTHAFPLTLRWFLMRILVGIFAYLLLCLLGLRDLREPWRDAGVRLAVGASNEAFLSWIELADGLVVRIVYILAVAKGISRLPDPITSHILVLLAQVYPGIF